MERVKSMITTHKDVILEAFGCWISLEPAHLLSSAMEEAWLWSVEREKCVKMNV